MFRRRPPLPEHLHDAWWSFVDCAEVIETGRRQLLATLPKGRVEPAPVGVGLDAVAGAIEDARRWMRSWRIEELQDVWQDCIRAMDEAEDAIPHAREVAAATGELEELLGAVEEVVAPLDAFADAERVWRRHWKVPDRREASTG